MFNKKQIYPSNINLSNEIIITNLIYIFKQIESKLDIEFKIYKTEEGDYYINTIFYSKILKQKFKISYLITKFMIYELTFFEGNDNMNLIVNSIIRNFLQSIDDEIINKKRTGIIPIKELPYEFFLKNFT